jgi:hypothetical protein
MSRTTDPLALQQLVEGLTAVAGRMEPKEAAAALNQAMAGTTDEHAVQQLAQGLAGVLLREGASRPGQRKRSTAGAVGMLSGPGSIPVAIALFHSALEPPPPPLPAQTLVDLLKHPLCVGEARRLVLEQLARHCRRPLADQWEFVRFAQEQNLDLVLKTAPQRPAH